MAITSEEYDEVKEVEEMLKEFLEGIRKIRSDCKYPKETGSVGIDGEKSEIKVVNSDGETIKSSKKIITKLGYMENFMLITNNWNHIKENYEELFESVGRRVEKCREMLEELDEKISPIACAEEIGQ